MDRQIDGFPEDIKNLPSTEWSAIQSLPLPNEVPPPPSLDKIPVRILHAATVETLINHNEDLSSRLKVQIRRGTLIEGQLVELELKLETVELARQSLTSQIEILREKDRAYAEKAAMVDDRFARINQDLDLATIENGELHRRNRELSTSSSNLKRQNLALRRRLDRWVKPGLEIRRQEIKTLTSHLESHKREVERLNAALSVLRQELSHSRNEADRRLASTDRDRGRLVEQYESTIQDLRNELKSKEGELLQALEKSAALDRMTSESARTTNERVFFERRSEELATQLQCETERLRGTIDDLGQECATLRASSETQRQLKDDSERRALSAEKEFARAETQLLSMRELWNDANIRLQALEAKNEALERLNSELSRKLNQKTETERNHVADRALTQVGFVENPVEHDDRIKRLDLLLSDLEMRAFGIDPEKERMRSAGKEI